LSVLLVPVADGINTLWQDNIAMQTFTSVAGIGLMMLIAMLPEWFAAQEKMFRERRRHAGVGAASVDLRNSNEINSYLANAKPVDSLISSR